MNKFFAFCAFFFIMDTFLQAGKLSRQKRLMLEEKEITQQFHAAFVEGNFEKVEKAIMEHDNMLSKNIVLKNKIVTDIENTCAEYIKKSERSLSARIWDGAIGYGLVLSPAAFVYHINKICTTLMPPAGNTMSDIVQCWDDIVPNFPWQALAFVPLVYIGAHLVLNSASDPSSKYCKMLKIKEFILQKYGSGGKKIKS
jgi:hypothetical protein